MICVKEELGDVRYFALYQDPLLDLAIDKTRLNLIRAIMNTFAINLNSIKFRTDLPSDKLICFNKFFGNTFVDVSIGIEELSVTINRLEDEQQAHDILSKIITAMKKIKGFEIANQKITLSQHYSSDEDSNDFFQTLNPKTLESLSDMIKNQGVLYHLFDEENNCNISILVDPSLVFAGGIFINADLQFYPNKFNFNEMFVYAKKKYYEIGFALGMEYKKG